MKFHPNRLCMAPLRLIPWTWHRSQGHFFHLQVLLPSPLQPIDAYKLSRHFREHWWYMNPQPLTWIGIKVSLRTLGSPNGVSVDVLGAIRLIQSKRLRILPSEMFRQNHPEHRWYPHRYSKNTHLINKKTMKMSQKNLQRFTDPKTWRGNVIIPGSFDQIPL